MRPEENYAASQTASRKDSRPARPPGVRHPEPWDAVTARILRGSLRGPDATSAGPGIVLGGVRRRDVTARDLANRGHRRRDGLPGPTISIGFGHTPEAVAETIRLAGEVAGLVGGSIEDATGDARRPIYDFQHAVERVAAAAAAARTLPFPFVLVGRAENFLHGRADLDDTIRRLQAFEAAGADALFAPGLTQAEDIRTVCGSVRKPVNVVMGLKSASFSVAELAALGVRRISVGSALSRAALGAFVRAAREIQEHGTFASRRMRSRMRKPTTSSYGSDRVRSGQSRKV